MTGGARGLCDPANAGCNPGYAAGFGYGRGLGLRRGFRGNLGPNGGRGRGFARGNGFYPPAPGAQYSLGPDEERETLQADADDMQRSLGAIRKRLDELEKKSSE